MTTGRALPTWVLGLGMLALVMLAGTAGVPATASQSGYTAAAEPAPAPTNGMLGFVDDGGFEVISPSNPTSTVPLLEPLNRRPAGYRFYQAPSWSPDGRSLAAIRVSEEATTIQLGDWSGRPTGAIGPWPGGELSGVWWLGSADRLLVAWRVADEHVELWSVAADGGDRERLAVMTHPVQDLSVAPDGSAIVYVRDVGDQDEVVRHDFSSGTSTVLLRHSYPMYDVDWSPDGARVAVVVGRSIWVMGSDGGPAEVVVDGEVHPVWSIAWSPDSRLVGFTAASLEESVASVDVESREVTPLLASRWGIGDLAWQPVPACTVAGSGGDDQLVGTPGDDVVCGGDGDDVLAASGGVDILIGGAGTDRVDFSGSDLGVVADLPRFWAGSGARRSHLVGVEDVTGSAFDDHLVGDDAANALRGASGQDLLLGAGGDDALDGGRGLDTVSYNAQDAFVAFDPDSVVVDLAAGTTVSTDGSTDDLSTLENVTGSGGADVLGGDESANTMLAKGPLAVVDGRGGDDLLVRGIVTYEDAPGPVTVDLTDRRAGEVSGVDGDDQVIHPDGVRGSELGDVFIGGLWSVTGLGGNDVFVPDYLVPVEGGRGRDTLDASMMVHGVDVRPGDEETPGRWYEFGRSGRYDLPLIDVERFILTDKRDRFTAGTAGGVRVDAGGRGDVLRGGPWADLLRGGSGGDVLTGHGGPDRLRPGRGADLVDGGSDRDYCASTPTDVVRRCEAGGGRR